MIKGVLIGNPVEKSISHITHNEIFKQCGIEAFYEKRNVVDLQELYAIKKEGYAWLAVTMPLKEAVRPFLDEGPGGPVNTILVRDGKWIGYNFDGEACLNAIGEVEGKRVLVLGAGGAAKSAIAEAVRRGAEVFVYNRTYERALGLGADALKKVEGEFDVVIQATSCGMFNREVPVDTGFLKPGMIVMDMVYNPPKTQFLEEALQKGCKVVFGYEMFAELTFSQMRLVFKDKIKKEIVSLVIKEFFL